MSTQDHLSRPEPQHYPPPAAAPSAWKSVPGFIRFAFWLWAILTIVYVVAVPVLLVVGMGSLTAYLGG